MSLLDQLLLRVRVQVTDTRDSGVWVKVLKDSRTGFIRRREISWDRRVGVIPRMPQPGEEFDAAIIEDSEERGLLYLSICRLTDPWEDVVAERRYQVGQFVEGEVVNARHFGAFVQLEPGIDAIIRPKDAPVRREQGIEGALWVGDRVRGVITMVDLERREIELSLWDALRRLDIASDRQQIQLNFLRDESEPVQPSRQQEIPIATESNHGVVRRFRPGIPRPQRFLVIDDEEEDLQSICKRLTEEYGVEADGVKSGKEAVAKVKQGIEYGLALIDIRLSGEHGTEVAERLRDVRPELSILYMSAARLADKDKVAIDKSETPLIGKELDEIVDWVDRLCNGYWIEVREPASVEVVGRDEFIRQLGIAAFARRSLQERLQDMLATLRRETGVTQTMVLELDPANKTVSVIAADPPLPDYILDRSSGLYYSPVRNVIEDEEEFRRNDINPDQDARFKNFFPLLSFRSCFGIPLFIPDHVTRHALFLLDKRPWSFTIKGGRISRCIRQTRLSARFLAVAIERSILLEHMRRYQGLYSHGQLLEDLVHEVNNKLGGLRAQATRLRDILPGTLHEPERGTHGWWLNKAKDAANEIAKAEAEIRQLVRAYERLARHDLEAVDVNDAVQKVSRQLEYTAKEAGVEVVLDLASDLPSARAIQSQLEQVVMNLVLNSIQQIELQSKLMENIGRERDEKTHLLQKGLVVVQTRYRGAGLACPIQIKVIDTGPGIHWQQQERIFSMGFSNRGGAGLGLFIGRNLVEMAGGQLSLAASLMFIGSNFVVELPAHPPTGEGQ